MVQFQRGKGTDWIVRMARLRRIQSNQLVIILIPRPDNVVEDFMADMVVMSYAGCTVSSVHLLFFLYASRCFIPKTFSPLLFFNLLSNRLQRSKSTLLFSIGIIRLQYISNAHRLHHQKVGASPLKTTFKSRKTHEIFLL